MSRLFLACFALLLIFCRYGLAQQTTANDAAATAVSDTKNDEAREEFLRIRRSESGAPVAMETAIATYTAPKGNAFAGAKVDLVGAVHIGERSYYAKLNELFEDYDVVLYELVAEEGTRVAKGEATAGRSPVSAMQLGMRDMLELEFQLDQIDYSVSNFRHADMSPEEFAENMQERGDSLVKMFFRMFGAGLATQSSTQGGDAAMLLALMSPNRAQQMKRLMAEQFREMDVAMAGIADADGRSTIITERNAKAFEVLKDELQQGSKRIAVFYGAGHLDDMAKRLRNDFGFEYTGSDWLVAWDLSK